jgi:uncharacterized protein (DUF58 family)
VSGSPTTGRARKDWRGALYVAGLLLVGSAISPLHSSWILAGGCALFGVVAVATLSLLVDTRTTLSLNHAPDFVLGEPATVQLRVHNPHARWSRPYVVTYTVRSQSRALMTARFYVDPVEPGDTAELTAEVIPLARGESNAGSWSIERISAFGLGTRTTTRRIERRVTVSPLRVAPPRLVLAETATGGGGRIGPGLDVRGAREWRHGDAARHVHWRTTARSGKLAVLERGEPMESRLGVLLVGVAGDPGFEAALADGAAAVARAVDDGVACFAWLEQPNAGCFGQLTAQTVLVPFVRVEAGNMPGAEGVAHLLDHVGPGGSLLIVATAAHRNAVRDWVAPHAALAGVDLVEFGGAW